MGVKLVSSSGGSVELNAPTTASNFALTVPANNGTVITTESTFAGTGPAFSAYGTALQSSANNTYTKIAFNTEEFDTNSNYDTSTYRFTPTVAGYYQINAAIQYGVSATNRVIIFLYKNGSIFKRGNALQNSATGPLQGIVSVLVYANGTTDYFEIYGWQNSGGSLNIGADSSDFAFSGCLVRAA